MIHRGLGINPGQPPAASDLSRFPLSARPIATLNAFGKDNNPPSRDATERLIAVAIGRFALAGRAEGSTLEDPRP